MADGRRLRCIHGSGETEILTSMKKSILVSLLALLMMGCQVSGGSSLKVEETTVEMRKNPEGVAVSAPRFSWQLVTDKQDVMQTVLIRLKWRTRKRACRPAPGWYGTAVVWSLANRC